MARPYIVLQLVAALFCSLLPGSLAAQPDEKKMTPAEQRQQLSTDTQNIIARYRKTDAGIERFFKDSAGYVVFPRVGKGGFIFAGGHGAGEVYEKGKVIGAASITMATVGLTVGIQEFSEIVFFENQAALDRFKQNKFEFTAGVSAVVLTTGAAKTANYRDGVAVFTQPTAGVMAEVSLGGQKFSFKPEGGAAKK